MERGGEGDACRLLSRGTSNSPNGVHTANLARRPVLLTPGLSLLCPLSWDWAPPWTLTHPTPSPKPQGLRAFHFPKVCVSMCWLVHLASSWMGWPVGGVGGWLIVAAGLLEDWEGHRFLPSPLPPPATTGCRLWLPSSPMGGYKRGESHR